MIKIKILHYLILSFAIVISVMTHVNQSMAQTDKGINWSKEEIVAQVSGVPQQSMYPVIAADNYGTVHIFWTEGEGIYYSYKKDLEWSQPINLVWGDQRQYSFPAALIDHNNILHLFWIGWGEIFHKSVPVREADNIKAWTEELIVVEFGGSGTPIRVALDSQNRIHLVFSDWYGLYGQTVEGNVYDIISSDSGLTWSDPTQVSFLPREELATDPRIAIDEDDNAHIVWGQMAPLLDGEFTGVFYSRLSQEGQLEKIQVEIDSPENDQRWLNNINIAVLDNDQVILIWTCGLDQAQRCYTYSYNGGDTWREPQMTFSELVGLSGWDALVVDGSNTLYWIGVLRYPQALYYSEWNGSSWQDPPAIASVDRIMKGGENINAVVSLGNQIHAVVQFRSEISYSYGITDAAGKPILTIPTTTAEILSTENSASTVSPTATIFIPTPTPFLYDITFTNEEVRSSSQLPAIISGIIPTLLILAIFSIVKLLRTK